MALLGRRGKRRPFLLQAMEMLNDFQARRRKKTDDLTKLKGNSIFNIDCWSFLIILDHIKMTDGHFRFPGKVCKTGKTGSAVKR